MILLRHIYVGCRILHWLMSVDNSFSTVYRLVADNISGIEGAGGNDTSFCRVADSSVGCNDTSLLRNVSHSLKLESNYYIEGDTNRVFRLSYIYELSHLKYMEHLFGIK